MHKIILASQSPRRRQLLQWANVLFEVVVSQSDESFPNDLLPAAAAIYIARNKALAVFNKSKQSSKREKTLDETEEFSVENVAVLAADTIVVLNDEIIGKPADRNHAIEILKKLSGKTHLVITGVVILFNSSEISFADTTEVQFYDLTEKQIEYYVDNYKPFDKAGAYAIQEWIGVTGIKSINGDFYNVMGLPISRVIRELDKLKK